MRILLDTHVYLWWIADSPALPQAARRMIEDAEVVFVSSASLWEAMIKVGIGKLEAEPAELVDGIKGSGFEELAITSTHTLSLQKLENFHKDPFDRMLVAQAVSEPLHLVTADSVLAAYSDLVIVV